jgi:hypothetical protein
MQQRAVILEFNVPSYRTRKRRRPDISENTESAAAHDEAEKADSGEIANGTGGSH